VLIAIGYVPTRRITTSLESNSLERKSMDLHTLMTHEHDFIKDLDGQVTCSICGAMDDEKPNVFETQRDFE